MEKLLTVVIPVIRLDMIERCLETLYKYTDNIFYCIVIDQSVKGMDVNLRDKYPNLMVIRSPKTDLHYTGNLGFTQATNLGLRMATTPYVMFLNDDVEFIHPAWWDGVMKTFEQVEKATPTRPPMLVNVASVKLPDWSVGKPAGEDFYILPYKENYTDEDWDFLVNKPHYVNEYLTIQPGTVIDGINLYGSVANTEMLRKVGFLDELFYPGGADDYDLCCRASMFGYRCVGTTHSWVFHHWSKSFADIRDKEEVGALVQEELKHGSLEEKWGYKEGVLNEDGTRISKFDMWGIVCTECSSIMHTDDGILAKCPNGHQSYTMPKTTTMPL